MNYPMQTTTTSVITAVWCCAMLHRNSSLGLRHTSEDLRSTNAAHATQDTNKMAVLWAFIRAKGLYFKCSEWWAKTTPTLLLYICTSSKSCLQFLVKTKHLPLHHRAPLQLKNKTFAPYLVRLWTAPPTPACYNYMHGSRVTRSSASLISAAPHHFWTVDWLPSIKVRFLYRVSAGLKSLTVPLFSAPAIYQAAHGSPCWKYALETMIKIFFLFLYS